MLPAPPQQKRLFLTFGGVVDQQATQRFFQTFTAAIRDGFSEVHLLIQSGGGTVVDGIAIYNFLRTLPLNITTYNAGSIQSIALLIFLAGRQRFANEHATFMIHAVTGPTGAFTAAQLGSFKDSVQDDDSRIEAILRSLIALPDDLWKERANVPVWVNASDATKYKIIDGLGDFAPGGKDIYNI